MEGKAQLALCRLVPAAWLQGKYRSNAPFSVTGNLWFVWPIDYNIKLLNFTNHKFPITGKRCIRMEMKSTVLQFSNFSGSCRLEVYGLHGGVS